MTNLFSVLALTLALAAPQDTVQPADTSAPAVISLEKAIEIALTENVSVKVADKEIEKTGYSRKGSYAALFPQIDGSASFQRTI